MADPAYVSNVDINFDNTTVPCAVFVAGPPKALIRFDTLDATSKADLDGLVTANGGSLPFTDLTNLSTYICLNGQTYFNTYAKALKSIGTKPLVPGNVTNSELVYYSGRWKHLYDDSNA